MKVIPVVQMVVIKDNAGQLGVIFPSEIDEMDNSQTSAFFIGIPRGVKNSQMLHSYLKRSQLVMHFFKDGEAININARLDFPVLQFTISKYAEGEKAISFRIDTIGDQLYERLRPSIIVKLSRTANKMMRYYRRNFKEGFINLKYRGNSSLINPNLKFILLRPTDASRYSGLFIKNKFIPVGATPEFGFNILKMYSVNENGNDADSYEFDV